MKNKEFKEKQEVVIWEDLEGRKGRVRYCEYIVLSKSEKNRAIDSSS